MQSEEQWVEVDKCPDCSSSIYVKGGEIKFTGPAGCGCWRPKPEGGEKDECIHEETL